MFVRTIATGHGGRLFVAIVLRGGLFGVLVNFLQNGDRVARSIPVARGSCQGWLWANFYVITDVLFQRTVTKWRPRGRRHKVSREDEKAICWDRRCVSETRYSITPVFSRSAESRIMARSLRKLHALTSSSILNKCHKISYQPHWRRDEAKEDFAIQLLWHFTPIFYSSPSPIRNLWVLEKKKNRRE